MSDQGAPPEGRKIPFRLAGFYAETSIHAGTGEALAGIDLPVSREEPHGYPFIAGSSLKGALRDMVRRRLGTEPPDTDKPTAKEIELFGTTDDHAGGVLPSDLRLLLLPVRSLSGAFRYVTCPHILKRFENDLRRADRPTDLRALRKNSADKALAATSGTLFLEELAFDTEKVALEELIGAVDAIAPGSKPNLERLIVVVPDDPFAWFARNALPVRARNRLDYATKTVVPGGLWYEESLPPDSILYGLFGKRLPDAVDELKGLLRQEGDYLQIGGNETVGQGWFKVAWVP